MAAADVCACARSTIRVVVLVLLGSALAGVCFPHVLAPASVRGYSAMIPFREYPGVRIRSTPGDRNSTLTPDVIRSPQPGLVRLMALKHIAGRRRRSDDDHDQSAGDVGSWRRARVAAPLSEGARGRDIHHHHRIGKSLVVGIHHRRGLRTSKPYPCTLPSPASCTPPASSCCGATCADVATNPNHCGRCGHVCKPDRACCNGKCRRLATDEKNCGRCGSRCALGTRCLYGLCGY